MIQPYPLCGEEAPMPRSGLGTKILIMLSQRHWGSIPQFEQPITMVWFSSIKAAAAATTTTTTTPTSPHSSSESPPPPAPAPPTASSTRHSRERCWAARDAFFDCLDAHGIIDSLSLKGKGKDLAAQKCRQEDIDFGKECVGSWVSVPFPTVLPRS